MQEQVPVACTCEAVTILWGQGDPPLVVPLHAGGALAVAGVLLDGADE